MNTVGKKVVSGILSACVAFPIGAALLTNSVQVNAAETTSRYETYEQLGSFNTGDIIYKGTQFTFNMARYSSFTLKVDGKVVAQASNGGSLSYTFKSDVMIESASNLGSYSGSSVLSCVTVESAVCDPLEIEPELDGEDPEENPAIEIVGVPTFFYPEDEADPEPEEDPVIERVCDPLFFEEADPDMWMVDEPLFFVMPDADEGITDITDTSVAPVAASTSTTAFVPARESSRMLTIRHFVESLYVDALGRNGTIEERNQWVGMILGQNVTGDMAVETFLTSNEFVNRNLDDEEFIEVINKIFFGGEMSAEAQADVLDDLNNGTSREDIVDQMIDTEAWASVCAFNLVIHEDKAS